jgi:hypothetical protein
MLFRKRSATGGALHNPNGARRPRDLSSGPHTARRSLVSPRQPLPHTAGRIRLCPCGFAQISGVSFPSNRGGFLYVAGWPGVILA